MSLQSSTQSVDDSLAVDDPQVDSAAAQWHSWAVKNSKQTTNTSSGSPDAVFSSTSHNRSLNLLDSLHTHHEHNEPHYSQDQDSDHHSLDLPIKVHSVFSEPPLCFCQKPASQSESAEFGIIYECHFMNFNNSVHTHPINLDDVKANKTNSSENAITHICGFHIHWPVWEKMGTVIKQNQLLDHENPELSTCPHFNFTYCVALRVFNSYKKSTPLAPRCFCNRRVVLSQCEYNSKQRMCFVCPNFYIEGAKPKCSWFLWAEELAFNRPKYPRHSPLLIDEAISRIRSERKSRIPSNTDTTPTSTTTTTTNNNTPASTSTSTSSSTVTTNDSDQYPLDHQQSPKSHEQHTFGLLSTLTSADPSSFKVTEYGSFTEKLQYDDFNGVEMGDENTNIKTGDNDNTKSDHSDNPATDNIDDTQEDDSDDVKKDNNDNMTTNNTSSICSNHSDDEQTHEHAAIPEDQPLADKQQYYNNDDDLDKQQDDGYHQYSDNLVYGFDNMNFIPPTTKRLSITHSRFIPPSVMRNSSQGRLPAPHHYEPTKKETIQQNDLDSLLATPYPSDNVTSRLLDEIIRHHVTPLASTIQQLQGKVGDLEEQVKYLKKKEFVVGQEIDYLRDSVDRERAEMKKNNELLENEKKQLQDTMGTEIALRRKNQQQLACMEESLENLLEENTTLAIEAAQMADAPKEPPKCQVCYSADVECAVVPCFHSVYCLECAQKLKECALCRIPKFSIQKVYLC